MGGREQFFVHVCALAILHICRCGWGDEVFFAAGRRERCDGAGNRQAGMEWAGFFAGLFLHIGRCGRQATLETGR